jgi:TupA-like ATPgrasp
MLTGLAPVARSRGESRNDVGMAQAMDCSGFDSAMGGSAIPKPSRAARQVAPRCNAAAQTDTCHEPSLASRLRILLTYGWRHRRLARLDPPQRFTEWVQWRKLYDHDPRMPALADKLMVKRHVANILGHEWITPTLFHAQDLPEVARWKAPFVVKSRHGSNQNAFIRTGWEDWGAIRSRARRWMRRPYGLLLDEWLYRHIPLGILVEPFIGTGPTLPVDYKIYVFGGRAVCVKVDRDREQRHWRAIYDLGWQPVWSPPGWRHQPPPAALGQMIEAAEALGRGFSFVRADFYEVRGRPRFGELTFYPGSGLSPLADDLDYWLGSHWTEAHAQSGR